MDQAALEVLFSKVGGYGKGGKGGRHNIGGGGVGLVTLDVSRNPILEPNARTVTISVL